ncbi:MAG: DUF4397 domain-containing protein [Lachnospirales bacterium]
MDCYIRFFNSVENLDNLRIIMGNLEVTRDLDFMQFTEYFKGYPGEYTVQIFHGDVLLHKENVSVLEGEIITLCITGNSLHNDLLKVVDSVDSHTLQENVSEMRFVNLVPFDTMYDVYIDESLEFENLEYRDISPFVKLIPKTYYTEVKNAFTGESKIIQPRMSVKNKYIYTSYIVGIDREGERMYIVNSLEGSTYIKS